MVEGVLGMVPSARGLDFLSFSSGGCFEVVSLSPSTSRLGRLLSRNRGGTALPDRSGAFSMRKVFGAEPGLFR